MSSQPAPPASAGRRSLRARGALSAALVALACLLAPLGTLSAWATYEVGDARRYVGAMRAPAAEPGVRRAVTDAVTEEILTELAAGPPENAGAGPPPGAVRDLVRRTVWSFTGTPAFREAWDTANRTTHDALMKGLREDGGEVPNTLPKAAN
ncbi:hypothetical protein [Streptomyces minutiscleroticus]|uniref:hypothetical protein n=1 Tax=Streptomyces minutiscleroticus TaxID=68238 RepID=UPI003324D588